MTADVSHHLETCKDECMNEASNMQTEMLPLKDWAERHGVSVRTVHNYLGKNQLPGADKSSGYWMIPATTMPPPKGAPAGRTIVISENGGAPVHVPGPEQALVPVQPHPTLLEGTQPLDGRSVLQILDGQPLFIEPALAARLIGVTENALRHELAEEYGIRKIGAKYLVPQRRIREEYGA